MQKYKNVSMAPQCMPKKEGDTSERQTPAVTNRGHLIPCCWLDTPNSLKHPIMKKLLKVSKIDDYESIDEILLTKEWINFAKNLSENNMDEIAPECYSMCKKRTGRDDIKKETYYYKGKIYNINGNLLD